MEVAWDALVMVITGHAGREWQSFYHFTVGGSVEDVRLTTLPAYDFETDIPRATSCNVA